MHRNATLAPDRPGIGIARAGLFGGLLALGLVGLPWLRSVFTGLDAVSPEDWPALALPLVAGALAGRQGRRARQHLFVVAVALAVVAAVAALATALALAHPGELALLAPLAAAHGVALALLAPGAIGHGARRWTTPAVAASAAAIAVAVLVFTRATEHPRGLTTALVLAPVLTLFAVAPASSSPPVAPPRPRVVAGLAFTAAAVLLCNALPRCLADGAPPLWPAVLAAGLAGALLALPASLPLAAMAFAALTAAVTVAPAAVPAVAPGRTLLAQSGAYAAVYDRADQELQLWRGAVLLDAEGPGRASSPLIATLLRGLLQPADRILLLGEGVGRLPAALGRAGLPMVDVAAFRTGAAPLLARLGSEGPVADPRPPAAVRPGTAVGSRVALRGLPARSRQAVVVTEPLHAAAPDQADLALQGELRRVVGAGYVVQPFALDRVPRAALAALLDAAAAVHPWNGVFAVGDCGLLLSGAAPPRWRPDDAFEADEDARWLGHAAHVGSVADLRRAFLGTVVADPPPAAGATDGADGRAGTLAILHARLVPAPPVEPDVASLFLWWTDVRSRLVIAERALRAARSDDDGRALARTLTAPFLPLGAPAAVLQAALGVPGQDGIALRDPDAASLAAHAIDPTFFRSPPPLFAGLPRPRRATGELEDFAALPADDRLVELCCGDGALAIALRARFRSRCARALVATLARGPLASPAMQALRELADPFVLDEVGRVLARRGALPELLALWRGDLAMPRALAGLLRGGVEDRRLLAGALGGRRDPGSLAGLADLLTDEVAEVRTAAGEALAATTKGAVAYDADWPRSRRFLAAERVRALHNRKP